MPVTKDKGKNATAPNIAPFMGQVVFPRPEPIPAEARIPRDRRKAKLSKLRPPATSP